jgi:hypothetical protein
VWLCGVGIQRGEKSDGGILVSLALALDERESVGSGRRTESGDDVRAAWAVKGCAVRSVRCEARRADTVASNGSLQY